MGGAEPKAFVRVNGRSLLARSLDAINSSGVASTVVVAAPEEFLFRAREEIAAVTANTECRMSITAVAGGNDRTESVQIALKHVGDAEFVLVHDAARCLTPPEVFRRVLAAVRSGAAAVVPVLPMVDTVRRVVPADSGSSRAAASESARPLVQVSSGSRERLSGALERADLRRVQTPQGFRTEVLLRAHEQHRRDSDAVSAEDAAAAGGTADTAAVGGAVPTDDAGLVERLGFDVVAVPGHEEALKITYPFDLLLGEQLARIRDESTGAAPLTSDTGSPATDTGSPATGADSPATDTDSLTRDSGEQR
nr:2-C-methyl-D-erythritol 4-phosphate cytidylyltransferase [Brevibacterium renqingii]